MADIYSISGSFFDSASWNDPSIWEGGVVPTSSDDVYIRGIRTTINNNIGNNIAYLPWSGSTDIRVANHTGFPSSGSFYVYTSRELTIKVNYGYLSGSNWFGDCTLDTDYESWTTDIYPVTESHPSQKGGFIPNGAYVQYRPGTIEIDNLDLTASLIMIENGGALKIQNQSTMSLGTDSGPGKITVRDGSLIVTGSNSIRWNYHYTNTGAESNTNNISWIRGENYPFSKIILEGTETRLNTTLSQSASIGDHYLEVVDASEFEDGDYIFVGEEDVTSSPTSDISTRVSNSYAVSSYDEVFTVRGKDTGSNYIYIQRMNGIEGIIKASASLSEYYVDDQRFKIGDKVLINNSLRTITDIDYDVDYEIRDYNFASGSDLTDWETDVTRSAYNLDWQIRPGLGLTQHVSTGYRHLFVKDLLMEEVKVEAWLSNRRNISFGIVDRDDFGVHIHANPSSDAHYVQPTQYQHEQRSSLSVDLNANEVFMTQYDSRNDYRDSDASGSLALNGEKKYTLEYSRNILKGYVNDELLYEQLNRGNVHAGRVGIFTNGNNSLTCTRFKVYAKYQKITLDSDITASVNDVIYETGVEYAHSASNEVIKLASVVTDPLDHKNLAFGLRGAEEFDNNSVYPMIVGNDLYSGSNFEFYNFHRLAQRPLGLYEFNHGDGERQSTIIDLTTPTSFSVVGFNETWYDNLQQFTRGEGITISGSDDNVTWTPITGGLDYRYNIGPGIFRDFNVGDQVYRYIRLEFNGETRANDNRIRGLMVQNFSQSRIEVNNVADFSVGDEIAIVAHSAYRPHRGSTEWLNAYTTTGSAATFLTEMKDHFTIESINGTTLHLDRPFKEGYLEKGALVVKLNKNLEISGSFDWVNNNWKTGRISAPNGFQPLRQYSFKHLSFQNLNNDTPNVSTRDYSGFYVSDYNYYRLAPFKGVSMYNCFNQQRYFWGRNYRNGIAYRGCYINANKGAGTDWAWAPFGYYDRNNGIGGVVTGNIVHHQSMNSFKGHRGIQVFSYNMVFGGSTYGVPYHSPYFATNYSPSANIITAIRNWSVSNTEGIGLGSTSANSQNQTWVYKIQNNKIENTINYPIRFNSQQDKDLETPVLFPKKTSLYNTRKYMLVSTNSSYNQDIYPVINNDTHIISPSINNFNRQGINFRFNQYGRWYTNPTDGYKRFYRFPQLSLGEAPYMAAYVYLDEGVSGSFDLTFDYYVDKSRKLQYQGVESGSAFIQVTKNGALVEDRQFLPYAENPTNITSTYTLEGPGLYQIALAGLDTSTGYIALNNVTSRITGPSEGMHVTSNTFNMRYFENGDQGLLKTAYVQGERDPKFRLQGIRIF